MPLKSSCIVQGFSALGKESQDLAHQSLALCGLENELCMSGSLEDHQLLRHWWIAASVNVSAGVDQRFDDGKVVDSGLVDGGPDGAAQNRLAVHTAKIALLVPVDYAGFVAFEKRIFVEERFQP